MTMRSAVDELRVAGADVELQRQVAVGYTASRGLHMREIVLALGVVLGSLLPWRAAADTGQRRPGSPQVSKDGLLKIDRSMFDLSARTGGEFYFWGPGEFVKYGARPLDTIDSGGGKAVVNDYGELPPGGRADVRVSIGPAVGLVRFFAGVQKKDFIEIRRPDGRAIASPDGGVEITDTQFMLIVKVPNPQPGTWKIVVAGQGRYQATARTRKRPDDDAFFHFMRVASGRHGPGLLKVDRLPSAGSEAICWASPDRDLDPVEFTFEASDGTLLSRLDLEKEAPSRPFLGRCRVPSEPFRFVARGVDRSGKRQEQRTAVMTWQVGGGASRHDGQTATPALGIHRKRSRAQPSRASGCFSATLTNFSAASVPDSLFLGVRPRNLVRCVRGTAVAGSSFFLR